MRGSAHSAGHRPILTGSGSSFRRVALRSEVDLRTLAAARARLVADIRKQIGVPLALPGCFVAGKLGSLETPTLEQIPADAVLQRRMSNRRWSGPFFIAGGLVWVWNGYALVA